MSAGNVWVDFNDVSPGGYVTTLRKFAAPGTNLDLGAMVTAEDGDGNARDARVHGTTSELVMLHLTDPDQGEP